MSMSSVTFAICRSPCCLPLAVSDVGGRLGPALFESGLERGVVALVLVGVFLGEIGDRLVEFVGAAEVGGQGDAVAGAGVGPGQAPPAQPGVGRHDRGGHLLDPGLEALFGICDWNWAMVSSTSR